MRVEISDFSFLSSFIHSCVRVVAMLVCCWLLVPLCWFRSSFSAFVCGSGDMASPRRPAAAISMARLSTLSSPLLLHSTQLDESSVDCDPFDGVRWRVD